MAARADLHPPTRMEGPQSDTALVTSASADREAFLRLYDRYISRVERYVAALPLQRRTYMWRKPSIPSVEPQPRTGAPSRAMITYGRFIRLT